jgi:glycosyltransferase involved in cell wall biosynthesis
MRLTILTQYYPPEVGAPQARLAELAAHFSTRGHEVSVLTAMPSYPGGRVHDGYGGLWRRELRDGVQVMRSYAYPTQSVALLPRLTSYFSFVSSSAVFGTAHLRSADFLLVESPPLFLGLSGIWLSRVTRSRLIFNVSDLWPETAVRLGVVREGGLSHRLASRLERYCYSQAWLVSGQSADIVSHIGDRFPHCRTYHLSNGVDSRRFAPHRRTPEARALLGGEHGCVALYAGLHGVAQGLDQVLDAAMRLQDVPGLRFVFCGDGPERAALRRRSAELGLANVSFLDPQPRDVMPALVASADIFVVPLRNHIPGAVPSKIYEAMASGVAIVLAASGEAADIVAGNEVGLAVPPGDVGALASAVRRLAGSPELRSTLCAHGRRAAEARFDRSTIGDRFAGLLEAELAGRAMPSRLSAALRAN